MVTRVPLFYGWVIVGIAVVSMTLIYGIRHTFSVFFPSILDEFGWSRGSTAIMLSLSILIYGFLAPIAGGFGDRWKPTRIMPAGIAVLGIAAASCGFASKLWHFYLLFGILAPIGTAFSGWPLMAPAMANWFAKRRGLAMGLGQMGGGLSFAYGIFAEMIISRLGWRYAYLVLGCVLVAILLPLFLLFFHYRPEDKGQRAYGAAGSTVPENPPTKTNIAADLQSFDWTLRAAMKTHQLWLLVLSNFFFWGIGAYIVLAHQVKFVQEAGYSSMFAASVFGLFGIFISAGQISSSISDWMGREKIATLANVLVIGALVALLSVKDASQPWLLYVYAVSFGYGAGLYSPTIFAGAADLFYGRHFGAISGLVLTGMGIGGAIGPWLGGYIYDISGSYSGAFVFSMICFALAWIAFLIAAPRNAKRLRT
jgi:sugar phosphate permease